MKSTISTAGGFALGPLKAAFDRLGTINRTFDVEVLRGGLKNDTLGTLLFPRDPVGNAPALIRSLATAFPARPGSYLLGLLVKIGWFTPTLVTLDLALILELGSRKRLLVLGRISSPLPSPDNDLIRLKLDAMGVLDFDAGTAIDAVLVDSQLAHPYALTGAMALRARWSAGPGSSFVLAVGGLHPQFPQPANLPRLERVAVALASGNNPRLTARRTSRSPPTRLLFHAQSGAAARAPAQRVGLARFITATAPAAATLNPSTGPSAFDETTAASVDPNVKTWSDYRASLARLNRASANWQMVPTTEDPR